MYCTVQCCDFVHSRTEKIVFFNFSQFRLLREKNNLNHSIKIKMSSYISRSAVSKNPFPKDILMNEVNIYSKIEVFIASG